MQPARHLLEDCVFHRLHSVAYCTRWGAEHTAPMLFAASSCFPCCCSDHLFTTNTTDALTFTSTALFMDKVPSLSQVCHWPDCYYFFLLLFLSFLLPSITLSHSLCSPERLTWTRPSVTTLHQFILRRQVISLYRDFNRALKLIDDAREKGELRDWIRHDFKQHIHLQDEEIIKMHLVRGRKALKQLQVTLTLPQVHSSGDDTNKSTNVWWALFLRQWAALLSFEWRCLHLLIDERGKESAVITCRYLLSQEWQTKEGPTNVPSSVAGRLLLELFLDALHHEAQ